MPRYFTFSALFIQFAFKIDFSKGTFWGFRNLKRILLRSRRVSKTHNFHLYLERADQTVKNLSLSYLETGELSFSCYSKISNPRRERTGLSDDREC